jgi:NACHT domain
LEDRRSLNVQDWLRAKSPVERQRVSIGERLAQTGRLVVLGDPGAGKTTLMRWIATAYLLRLKQDDHWKELPDVKTLPDSDWLPIIVRCRDLQRETLAGSLEDILRLTLRRSELNANETASLSANLLKRLREGTSLLMLDGLDEISDPTSRARFCQHVEEIVSAYPRAPIIATSRIVGYREMGYRIGRGFEHLTLADLGPDDQNDFARRWCLLTEIPERQQSAYEELVHDIHSSERIERLTSNPMLLTTMALVKRKVGKLPNRRIDLYWEAVQVLLNWRREVDEPIDWREAIPQLEYLAYSMCDQGVQRLPRDEILDCFTRLREAYPNVHPARARTPEQFLSRLESRTGILVEAGHIRKLGMLEPVYEFRHLTFQEYLAARALVDNKFPDHDPGRTLADHVAHLSGRTTNQQTSDGATNETTVVENWRETLRLVAAMCSDDIADAVLLSIALPLKDEQTQVARARAALAALCLVDEPNVSEAAAEQAIDSFVSNVTSDDGFRGKTACDLAMRWISGTRWEGRFRQRLIQRFGRLATEQDFAAGMLTGLLGVPQAFTGKLGLDLFLAEQEARLKSYEELEAVDASLRIFQALGQAYSSEIMCELPNSLADSLIENLKDSNLRAGAAAWGLVALVAPLIYSAPELAMWQPMPHQIDAVILCLQDQNVPLVTTMALAMLIIATKDERAVDSLAIRLSHSDPDLREVCADALIRVAKPEGLSLVAALTDDPASSVRQFALEAKAKLAGVDGIELALLTKDLNGDRPFIDPQELIPVDQLEKASANKGLSLLEVRSVYEVLTTSMGLRLAWREDHVTSSG